MAQDFLELLDKKASLHQKGWIWQRILLFLLFLFIIAGGIGVFGDGLASQQTAGEQSAGWWITYGCLARQDAPMKLEMHWNTSHSGVSVIRIPNHYLQHFQVESVTPEPVAVNTYHNQVHYSFSGSGAQTVLFYLRPAQAGRLRSRLHINDYTFELQHFIYP